MIQVTTITGQALSKITPTTIGKDKATVTLTFTKQYDLAPKVQAKSTSVTKDANDCIIEADGMSVKCLFTIDTAGTYSIVYNGIQTTKELVVAGRYVAVSMYMILVLIIL